MKEEIIGELWEINASWSPNTQIKQKNVNCTEIDGLKMFAETGGNLTILRK